MKIYAKKLLTPGGWRENQVVEIENGSIARVFPGEEGDFTCDLLTPGLFDVHAHGGEGFYSLSPRQDLLEKYLMRLARGGITDVLIGVSTYVGAEGYHKALDFIRNAMEMQEKGELGGVRIRGVHLEGPFLSPDRPGAMNPDAMLAPTPENFDSIFAPYMDIIKLVTLAPEREGARELTAYLLKNGICVQAGHTDATYEQAEAAFAWGVDSQCHTFNAARGIHHREPGIVAAALLHDNVFCETICDFKHLHPATVKLIYRMKGPDRMTVISDSVAVTGLPDGEHIVNGKKYLIVDGTQRVKGGNTLSGGACYMDKAMKNLISIGIPDYDAFRMGSYTPALRMKMDREIGSILPGYDAHLAGWNADYSLLFTIVCNRSIAQSEAPVR